MKSFRAYFKTLILFQFVVFGSGMFHLKTEQKEMDSVNSGSFGEDEDSFDGFNWDILNIKPPSGLQISLQSPNIVPMEDKVFEKTHGFLPVLHSTMPSIRPTRNIRICNYEFNPHFYPHLFYSLSPNLMYPIHIFLKGKYGSDLRQQTVFGLKISKSAILDECIPVVELYLNGQSKSIGVNDASSPISVNKYDVTKVLENTFRFVADIKETYYEFNARIADRFDPSNDPLKSPFLGLQLRGAQASLCRMEITHVGRNEEFFSVVPYDPCPLGSLHNWL